MQNMSGFWQNNPNLNQKLEKVNIFQLKCGAAHWLTSSTVSGINSRLVVTEI